MTGSGTQQDPYILTTWAELIASRSVSSYSVWQGGDLDFNIIAPNGFTSDVIILGAVDFGGATFKNLYLRNCSLRMRYDVGTVKNWNLINCYILPEYGAIYFGTAMYTYVNDIKISAIVTTSSDNRSFLSCGYGGNGYMYFNRCAITLECISANKVYLTDDSACSFYDCALKLDMETPAVSLGYYQRNKFNNCKITGKVLNSYGNAVKLGINHVSSFFDLNEGTYEGSSSPVSVYNSEKCTITGEGMEGCTTSELGDAEYLHSIGFPIGVD